MDGAPKPQSGPHICSERHFSSDACPTVFETRPQEYVRNPWRVLSISYPIPVASMTTSNPDEQTAKAPNAARNRIRAFLHWLSSDPAWICMKRGFALDHRSIALFRFCLGAVLLSNLACRVVGFEFFLTDAAGIFSLEAKKNLLSFHDASASPWFQGALLGFMALCCLPFMLGRYARVFGLTLYVFYVSLYNQTPMIGNGGDKLLCLALFISILLPSTRMELRLRRPFIFVRDDVHVPTSSFTGFAISVQLACIYFFSGMLKTKSWHNGTAVYNALISEKYSYPWSHPLTQYPDLLEFATYTTLAAEILAGFILFFPPIRNLHRWIPFAVFCGFHLNLALTMCLGHFPFVALALWTVMIPGSLWELLRKKLRLPSWEPLPARAERWSALQKLVVAVFLLLVVTVNLDRYKTIDLPSSITRTVDKIRLQQNWGLFKNPGGTIVWTVPIREARDETPLNLFDRTPITENEKPHLTSAYGDTHRWHKFLQRIRSKSKRPYRDAYLKYLCAEELERSDRLDGDFAIALYSISYTKNHKVKQKKLLARRRCTDPQAPTSRDNRGRTPIARHSTPDADAR